MPECGKTKLDLVILMEKKKLKSDKCMLLFILNSQHLYLSSSTLA